MEVYEVMTSKSADPYLVIACGFGSALKVLGMRGIRENDITFIHKREAYHGLNILIEDSLISREALRKQVTAEIQKMMPRWLPGPVGAAGGGNYDMFLIRTSRGHYFTSPCIAGPDNHYLMLEDLENLPGLPKEE